MEQVATVEPATEPAATPAPEVVTTQSLVEPSDPFALDETSLGSFSPEQRASLDPILKAWKERATAEITKKETEASSKYKPIEEKAKALEKLTQYQPFVQWWQAQQKNAAVGAPEGQQTAIAQTKPADFATPQEWQEALWEASQGQGEKLQGIQSRMMNAWATPFVQQLTQKQQYLETQMDMKDLFERHPDAKTLDAIGIDSKSGEGVSLLEMGLDWAERNRRPLEDGYQLAKRWADQMSVGAQRQAMGMVQGKKQEVTAGNSPSRSDTSFVEVENADELLKKSLEANMAGNKGVRFVIKGSR